MVINFHEHTWKGVGEHNAKLGIDRVVLLPEQDTNELACEMAAEEPSRFIPFYRPAIGGIVKSCTEVRGYAARGAKGAKLHPLCDRMLPSDPRLFPFYQVCQELGLIVLIHAGIVEDERAKYGNPVEVDEVAWEFPDLKVVIAHLGGNYSFEALSVCSKHANVYMDTSYLNYFCDRSLPKVTPIELVKRAVEFCGPEKVLYGSEGVLPELIADSDLPGEVKEGILFANAERLLGER